MQRYLLPLLFSLLLLALFPLSGFAQADTLRADSAVTLGEATVRADRVVRTPDGFKLYPSAEQLAASADGYGLLQRLSLPQVQVDAVTQTIKANEMVGSVQVRINGIVAGVQDLQSLEIGSVRSVEYIRDPAPRYGDGVGIVLNIHTARAEGGIAAGGSVMEAVTTPLLRSNVYARRNRGRHELSAAYSFGLSEAGKSISTEEAVYTLSDGSEYVVQREARGGKSRRSDHALNLKYSQVEAEKYVLQATLSGTFGDTPGAETVGTETDSLGVRTVRSHTALQAFTPQADVYFHAYLPHGQFFTANAVGSYRRETYAYGYLSARPYAYDVDSRLYSLVAEACYEKRWKPFTLTLGGRYVRTDAHDDYAGDVSTLNRQHRQQFSLYAHLAGRVGAFAYKGDLRYAGFRYRQGDAQRCYRSVLPRLSLSYVPIRPLRLSYDFAMTHDLPRMALVNDIVTKRNDMEYVAGNPAVAPHYRYEHTVSVTWDARRVRSYLSVLYRVNPDTWMDDIVRTDEDRFILGKANKGAVNMLYITDDTTIQLIPERLEVNLSGSFIRCFNLADTYTHCYSAWMGGVGFRAYVGRLSLTAHADNGWKSMEGETRLHNAGQTYLSAGYRLGKWGHLNLAWQQLLDTTGGKNRIWLTARDVRKTMTAYAPSWGNMVSIGLSVHLSRGRKYSRVEKAMDNSAVESSAVKVE